MTYRNRGTAMTADRREARKRVAMGAHSLVLVTQGDESVRGFASKMERFINWWEDLRRGQNTIYGSLLRFLDIGIAHGTSRATLLQIPAMLTWYIHDRCDDRARQRGYATGEFDSAA